MGIKRDSDSLPLNPKHKNMSYNSKQQKMYENKKFAAKYEKNFYRCRNDGSMQDASANVLVCRLVASSFSLHM